METEKKRDIKQRQYKKEAGTFKRRDTKPRHNVRTQSGDTKNKRQIAGALKKKRHKARTQKETQKRDT